MKMRAPFRYWGAKVRMAPWIIERLPEHNHFIEACAGSAAVMAVKPPVDAETLSDIYGEVINFFRVLQDPETATTLIDRVSFTPYAHDEFRLALDLIDADTDATTRAWAFFVRMQMAVVPGRTGWSYGVSGPSTKKANKAGRWSTMPDLLRLAVERFARVQVTNWDVCDLIERLDTRGALIFVDPPYLETSRPTSTGSSSAYEHNEFDHTRFIEAMLSAKHASFALTHYPHPVYDVVMEGAGDYMSHRNIPNGAGRDEQVERLYVIRR